MLYIFKVTNFKMRVSWKWWELAKNAQVWLYRGWYLPSNETIANAVLCDFDLKFHSFKHFKWLFWKTKARKIKTLVLSSDICYRLAPLWMLYVMTLTYIFNVTNFEMSVLWKRWELAKKMLGCKLYRGWYSPSMGPLRMLNSVTLIFILKVKHFLVMYWL